jgi:ankyrin repeat protein
MAKWLTLLMFALISPAAAQVPPSAAELQSYTGLHAASAQGDAAKIEQLVKSGAPLDARDGNGRTPLHVAIFRQVRRRASWSSSARMRTLSTRSATIS